MEFLNLILINTTRNIILLIILICLILIGLSAYIIFIRLERKISIFYPGKRNRYKTLAIKKINEGYLKQGKQIDAFKFVIKITIEIRNLIHRLSGEIKNIDEVYDDLKFSKNSDFEILQELKTNLEVLLINLEKLSKSKEKDLNQEFLILITRLKLVLSECNEITSQILDLETGKAERSFISDSAVRIDSDYLIIKDIHDELIRNFQELFSKDL
jgi:hypothetical protein